MRHTIHFVKDDELPATHDWVLVRTRDAYRFFIKESKVTPEALMSGWAAYVELTSPQLRSA